MPDEPPERPPEEEAAASARPDWARWIVLGIAALLGITAIVLLCTHDPREMRIAFTPKKGPGSHGSLTLLLFQHHVTGLEGETPWRLVQGQVAAGTEMMVAYSVDRRRRPYLTILAVDDLMRVHFLLPGGGPAKGRLRSVRVQVPARAVPLRQRFVVPQGISRLDFHGLLSHRSLDLKAVARAVIAAHRAGESGSQVELPLPRVDQHSIRLDVLP